MTKVRRESSADSAARFLESYRRRMRNRRLRMRALANEIRRQIAKERAYPPLTGHEVP